jgi:hypothetical protein
MGSFVSLADEVPEELLEKYLKEIHEGSCPMCGGPGPVDVRLAHYVWSILVLTSDYCQQEVCCRGCGIRLTLTALLFSSLFGWWGFPYGFIMTPVQIVRNLWALITPPDASRPSDLLREFARMQVAGQVYKATNQDPAPEPSSQVTHSPPPDPWAL